MENASYSFVNLGSIKGFNDILCEQNIDGSCSSSNILKLNKIDCRTENNQKYKIIKYDKSILNNDLINAGYSITNENREEKYLQILETGDEKLISKLEDYLNYKDEIEKVAHLERKFSKFKDNVLSSSTVEDVTEITNKFLENFYLNY